MARKHDQRAAVLAIDPSSPLTGGAILGDRVRMHQAAVDEGVFIRSMASRGDQGGLAQAASLGVRVLEACGWPWILLETVGIGQVEVEISGRADLVVVVLNPGWGDEIQANKAGLMEVADIFVINKADREGVAQTRRDIEGAIAARPGGHEIPVIETIATRGEGVDQLWDAIGARHAVLEACGELQTRRSARIAAELESAAMSALRGRLAAALAGEQGTSLRARIAAGGCGVHEGVAQLLQTIVRD
jgi:LAO/AO transport system kinase